MPFAKLYPLYVAKCQKKGREEDEIITIICWLTGYSREELSALCRSSVDVETFFTTAPALNPKRRLIKGSVCGVKIADREDGLMKEIRYLDRLIDELAKGKPMEKII